MNGEPLITSTSIGVILGAIFAVLVSFGVNISNEQIEAILQLVALLAPIAVSVFYAPRKSLRSVAPTITA